MVKVTYLLIPLVVSTALAAGLPTVPAPLTSDQKNTILKLQLILQRLESQGGQIRARADQQIAAINQQIEAQIEQLRQEYRKRQADLSIILASIAKPNWEIDQNDPELKWKKIEQAVSPSLSPKDAK